MGVVTKKALGLSNANKGHKEHDVCFFTIPSFTNLVLEKIYAVITEQHDSHLFTES